MQAIRKLFQSKITKNAVWLIGGRVINMLISLFVGLLTARYLGPGNFGLINYALAYTSFFFSLCTLGINSVIVKNFVDHPDEEGVTIGTTLVLRGISSILSSVMILGIVQFVDKEEPLTIVVVALCSIGLIFQIFDTFNYWFQSKLQSKYPAMATTVAYIIMSAYKIVLLLLGKNVEWFAVATSVDYICIAIFLFVVYKRKKGPQLKFSVKKAKELLGSSYHYILAGLMISIYGSTDKLMLKQMLGESAVGYYSTAVQVCNLWVFVLSAIIDSLFPSIMELYAKDKAAFERKNRQLYAIVFYCSVSVSVLFVVFGGIAIHIMYGAAYMPAVAPLRIVTWYVAFSYLGVARNAWVVCEEKQKYLKYLYLGAAVVNVILNVLMIPWLGTSGAALASLITQFSTILVFPFLIKDLRSNAKLMLDAIFLKGIK